MKKSVFLLVGIVVLYLATGGVLQLVYGPSFGFLSGEDCWIPDGQGGWMAHGNPSGLPPSESSVEVPILARYFPIFVPAGLLVLVMFTPLGRKLDSPRPAEEPPPETGTPADQPPDNA